MWGKAISLLLSISRVSNLYGCEIYSERLRNQAITVFDVASHIQNRCAAMSGLSNEVRLSSWEVAISGSIRHRTQSDAIVEETRGVSFEECRVHSREREDRKRFFRVLSQVSASCYAHKLRITHINTYKRIKKLESNKNQKNNSNFFFYLLIERRIFIQ